MAELSAKRSGTRAGLAVSVLLHLAFVTAAILSLPWRGPPPDPQGVEVTLVSPPLAVQPIRPRPRRPLSASPAQAVATVVPAVEAPAPNAIRAPAAAPAATGEDQVQAGVRAMLRGSVGCSETVLIHLTQAEKDRCAKWLRAHLDPNLEIPAPIPPEKRAWYDATVAARNAPDHGPGLVCFGKPPHGLKLGPLPCYVEPPKGPLSEDVDAPPEPDRRR